MLINDLKLLLKFDNEDSIFEGVSQTYMSVLGSDTTPIISSSGYQMQDDQYLFGDGLSSNGYNLSITNQYTIGFWLYSVNLGMAVDSSNNVLSSIETPLLNIVNGNSYDISNIIESVINITEHTSSDGTNYLKVEETNGQYSASSENYTPNSWHYFWIIHNVSGLTIYVDGIINTLQNETGSFVGEIGTLDPSSGYPLLSLYINLSTNF